MTGPLAAAVTAELVVCIVIFAIAAAITKADAILASVGILS